MPPPSLRIDDLLPLPRGFFVAIIYVKVCLIFLCVYCKLSYTSSPSPPAIGSSSKCRINGPAGRGTEGGSYRNQKGSPPSGGRPGTSEVPCMRTVPARGRQRRRGGRVRLKAAVSKRLAPKASVVSNPLPSAIGRDRNFDRFVIPPLQTGGTMKFFCHILSLVTLVVVLVLDVRWARSWFLAERDGR